MKITQRYGKFLSLALLTLFLLSSGTLLAGGKMRIKLGTLAPEGSPWYKAMRAMGDEWAQKSNGELQLKIYPGGVSGNEGQIIRKMRINQLQAGMISATGLIDIERSSISFQLPLTISDYDELDYVLAKIEPLLNERIEAAGFKVLAWGDAGWVYFFTKEPVTTPTQLKEVKLWSWEGDPPATEAFTKAGLKPVVIAATDVLPALQTGMVEGFPQTALAALSLQWFGGAKNMINLKWSPMLGATVITMKAWEKIPEKYRDMVLEAGRKHGKELSKEVRRLDQDAIGQMKKYGLNVVEPTNLDQWKAFGASFEPLMRDSVMVPDVVDKIKALHKEYQAKK